MAARGVGAAGRTGATSGILMPFSPSDKEMQGRVQALKEELQNRG